MLRSELGRAALCIAAFFFGGISESRPFASRFFRLSRLLRFALAPSACRDALFEGAGEALAFKSDSALLIGGPFPGAKAGELMLDDGADGPADAIVINCRNREALSVLALAYELEE